MTTTLLKQNLQKLSEPFPPNSLSVCPEWGPEDIHYTLRNNGCGGCALHHTDVKPVVYRGNPKSNKIILGEAPGLKEAEAGQPFVGPAGQLLDRIWKSVGWDTNDWYLSNVVKCRPIAQPHAGKQNLTPQQCHRDACKPYLERELQYLKPQVIVLLGKSAVLGLYPQYANQPMHKLVGKWFTHENYPLASIFVMYHPAYVLRQQFQHHHGVYIRQATWKHIQELRDMVNETLAIG